MIEKLIEWFRYEPNNNSIQFRISNFMEIHVEIGFGKGDFIIEQAQRNNKTMFIGFEIKTHQFNQVMSKIKLNNIHNILIFNCDGIKFIREQFPDKFIDVLHIYFPHFAIDFKCERIVSPTSMKDFHRILKRNAQLRLVTDKEDKFSIAIKNLNKTDYYLKEWVPFSSNNNGFFLNSEWGKKFKEADELYYIFARKII